MMDTQRLSDCDLREAEYEGAPSGFGCVRRAVCAANPADRARVLQLRHKLLKSLSTVKRLDKGMTATGLTISLAEFA